MAIIPQRELFNWKNVEVESDLKRLEYVLDNLNDESLMRLLEKQRGRGRDDYPLRVLFNCLIAMIVFGHNSVSSFIREMRRNAELRCAVGCDPFKGIEACPPSYVFSRFFRLLDKVSSEIEGLFDSLVADLKRLLPDFGREIAVDSKAIHSFAKKKSRRKKGDRRSEMDADTGFKTYAMEIGGGKTARVEKKWHGYKLHYFVDARYELPLRYEVTRASVGDSPMLAKLLAGASAKHPEIIAGCRHILGDRGYDSSENNALLFDRYGITPVIDIRNMWRDGEETRLIAPERAGNIVYNARGDVMCVCPSSNEMRSMAYWGFEHDRRTLKYRCPASAYGLSCMGREGCASGGKYGRVVRVSIDENRRLFVPLPRSTYKWKRTYRKRSAIERVNSRLDVSFGFEHHSIRGLKKMRLFVGISLTVMLAMAVGVIRAGREDLMRSLVGTARAA